MQKNIVSDNKDDNISSSDDSVDVESSFYLLIIFIKTFYMNQNVIFSVFQIRGSVSDD